MQRSMSTSLKRKLSRSLSSRLSLRSYYQLRTEEGGPQDREGVPLLSDASKLGRSSSLSSLGRARKRYKTRELHNKLETCEESKAESKLPIALQDEIVTIKTSPPPAKDPEAQDDPFVDLPDSPKSAPPTFAVPERPSSSPPVLQKRERKRDSWKSTIVDAWKRMQTTCPYCQENGECWAGTVMFG